MEWDLGPNQRIVAAIGQPSFAHQGGNKPKTKLSRNNKHHREDLFGATWLPMGLQVLPLSPNDQPTIV